MKRALVRWGAVVWIAGVIVAAVTCTGCSSPPKTPDDALLREAASHEAELAICIAKGKAAHSMPVYTACADAVDARYGISVTVPR